MNKSIYSRYTAKFLALFNAKSKPEPITFPEQKKIVYPPVTFYDDDYKIHYNYLGKKSEE